ncbi:MAG: phosphotransferase [Actinomycetia bacterium]|nr:phosphotransferase [Actinomycetes bacterium]
MTDFEQVARQALASWNISADAEVTLIKQRENAVFSVGSDSDRYALRVHRRGYHSDAALRSELEWSSALNDAAVRTPRAIPTVDGKLFAKLDSNDGGDSHQVDLLEWFDGEPIGSAEEGLADGAEAAEVFSLVGELMARTHNHAATWALPTGFERHVWDEDGILGDQPLWGRYQDLAALDAAQRSRIGAAVTKAAADLADFGKTPDRYGLIHADLIPDNLLRSDDGICLIDFDDGGFGWFMFDIATTLFIHLGKDYFDDALNGLLGGYSNHRELADEHLAQLPLFLFMRGLTYLGWVHTRRDTETAVAMTPAVVAGVDMIITSYLEG